MHEAHIDGDCPVAILQVLEAMDAEARAQVGPWFLFEVSSDGVSWQKYNPADHEDLADLALSICSGTYTAPGPVYEIKAFDTVTPAGLPRVLLSSGRVTGGPREAPWYRRHAAPLVLGALTLAGGVAAATVAWRKRKRGR